ncbi:unnamed protein product [Adineta ricciae]|uniref:Uncharacterized protein n=1 Tax=Adineta ricciae TaxID=249248 RepID=A0A816FWH9_ADIRI|nr:unnamed protein product [Adineta ricciae]CAF1667007.1 unnamed protein product [Adineta ricciae]
MFDSMINNSQRYEEYQGDRLGNLGISSNYEPTITVIVQWTPEFGQAYQQFVNSGMGTMNNYGGYGIGI